MLATVLCLSAYPERPAHASCDVIPSAARPFNGTLGALSRPFAAPGEVVDVHLRPCDVDPLGPSAGLQGDPGDYVVTVLFDPAGLPGAERTAIVLAATCPVATGSCSQSLNGGAIRCIEGAEAGVAFVFRDGKTHLRFSFPDTDGEVDAADDERTLAGPATIVVTRPADVQGGETDPLQCSGVTLGCAAIADRSGVVACIDDLFVEDGTCGAGSPHGTFSRFTALPPPNDFQALCFQDAPPCAAEDGELRLTADLAGNILVPMDWSGVRPEGGAVPIPRQVVGAVNFPVPVSIPSRSFLSSFTGGGSPLPPIFEPQIGSTGALALYGLTDAPYSVLRLARRSAAFRQCSGGDNDGLPCLGASDCPGSCLIGGAACTTDADCPSGTCGPVGSCAAATCIAGPNVGKSCAGDADCFGAECGPSNYSVAALRALASESGVGAIVLPRLAGGAAGSFCQVDSALSCDAEPDPACGPAPCVDYALEAKTPVLLDGVSETSTMLALAVDESVNGRDSNGDDDLADDVLTLVERATGRIVKIGASCANPACPGGQAVGRAVARTHEAPYGYPSVAAEGDIVAFLEPEESQFGEDSNENGQLFETHLRIFKRNGATASDVLSGAIVAADPAPIVNGQGLAISEGLVFSRQPERDSVPWRTSRVSVRTDGSQCLAHSQNHFVSGNGRFVLFESSCAFDPVNDTNGAIDGYVRDLCIEDGVPVSPCTPSTELVTLPDAAEAATVGNGTSNPRAISADGRFIAFASTATNLVPGDSNGHRDVFLRDRSNDTTIRVSLASNGDQANADCDGATGLSTDGRFVTFYTDADNIVPGDSNAARDLFIRDVQEETTTRVNVSSEGVEANAEVHHTSAALTPDGRFVGFLSTATNLVPNDTNTCGGCVPAGCCMDAFVRDTHTGITERVDVSTDGEQADRAVRFWIWLSDDGRYVSFESEATNLVPDDTNGVRDVFLRDRLRGATERVSVSSTGAGGNGDSDTASISGDGRYVVFTSAASNLHPDDAESLVLDDYVYNRSTGLLSIVSIDTGGNKGTWHSDVIRVSTDGSMIVLYSGAVLDPADTNGMIDVYARFADPLLGGDDLSGDDDTNDTVLETTDPATLDRTRLCPANDTVVTQGMAAFLRPESAGTTSQAIDKLPLCPTDAPLVGGKPDLNGDGDAVDQVVHLWRGAGMVENLHCAASQIAFSGAIVAAIVDGFVKYYPLNDSVPASCAAWHSTGQPASAIGVSGGWIVMLTPETNVSLNLTSGDTDLEDEVLQVYDTAQQTLRNTGAAARDFVVGSSFVAFRIPEAAQNGENLNGPPTGDDTDPSDSVLAIYLLGSEAEPVSTRQAATPCRLEACDPRTPYKIIGNSVRFLTDETEQTQDLDGDGLISKIVLQVVTVQETPAAATIAARGLLEAQDVHPPSVSVHTVGAIEAATGRSVDPLREPMLESAVLLMASGRCVQGGEILASPVTCTATADCPAGSICEPALIPAAHTAEDTDGDGVPDSLDNCDLRANAAQADADDDGIGDACDSICSGGAAIAKSMLKIAGLNNPGRQRLTFKGELGFGPGEPAVGFDPPGSGAQILVEDLGAGSTSIFEMSARIGRPIPAGAVGSACSTTKDGWTWNPPMTLFRYKNGSNSIDPPACTAASANGLTKFELADQRVRNSRILAKITTSKSSIAPPVGPLRVTIVTDANLAAGTTLQNCATVTFGANACRRLGAAFSCRQ